MQVANHIEVQAVLDSVSEAGVLGLKHILLQVRIDVVDQEGHVLSHLDDLSEERVAGDLFLVADAVGPDELQVELDAFDRQQEAEQRVVLLDHIRREHEVQGPV